MSFLKTSISLFWCWHRKMTHYAYLGPLRFSLKKTIEFTECFVLWFHSTMCLCGSSLFTLFLVLQGTFSSHRLWLSSFLISFLVFDRSFLISYWVIRALLICFLDIDYGCPLPLLQSTYICTLLHFHFITCMLLSISLMR